MKLYTHPYYNPYFVKVRDKEYQINSITVFDTSGELAEVPRGWFGSNNYTKELSLDVECVVKRKVDYNMKDAFIISHPTPHGETRYDLYIPNSVVNLTSPKYERVYSGQAIKETIQSINFSEIYFESFYWINGKVKTIENQIMELGKKISTIYSDKYDNLPGYIEQLSKLTADLSEAVTNMNETPIEEHLSRFSKFKKGTI